MISFLNQTLTSSFSQIYLQLSSRGCLEEKALKYFSPPQQKCNSDMDESTNVTATEKTLSFFPVSDGIVHAK